MNIFLPKQLLTANFEGRISVFILLNLLLLLSISTLLISLFLLPMATRLNHPPQDARSYLSTAASAHLEENFYFRNVSKGRHNVEISNVPTRSQEEVKCLRAENAKLQKDIRKLEENESLQIRKENLRKMLPSISPALRSVPRKNHHPANAPRGKVDKRLPKKNLQRTHKKNLPQMVPNVKASRSSSSRSSASSGAILALSARVLAMESALKSLKEAVVNGSGLLQQPYEHVHGVHDENNENFGSIDKPNISPNKDSPGCEQTSPNHVAETQEYSQSSTSGTGDTPPQSQDRLITLFKPCIPMTPIRAKEKSRYVIPGFAFQSMQEKSFVCIQKCVVRINFEMILNKSFFPKGCGKRTKLTYLGFRYGDRTSSMYVAVKDVTIEYLSSLDRLRNPGQGHKTSRNVQYGTKYVNITMPKETEKQLSEMAIDSYRKVYGYEKIPTVERKIIRDDERVMLKANIKPEYSVEKSGDRMTILEALLRQGGRIHGDALLFMRFSRTNGGPPILRYRPFSLLKGGISTLK